MFGLSCVRNKGTRSSFEDRRDGERVPPRSSLPYLFDSLTTHNPHHRRFDWMRFNNSLCLLFLLCVIITFEVISSSAPNPILSLPIHKTMSVSTASKHTVLYFDIAGRAEAIRILLHIAGIDFEDKRFAFAEWKDIKPTTPLGQVPVLRIDETQYTQSSALARYAAKLAGWYPMDDPLQALIVDEVVEAANELMTKAPKSKDPQELKTLREEFQATTMKQYASLIEQRIQASESGTSVAKTMSFADLIVTGMVKSIQKGTWDHINPKFFEDYPGIMAVYKAVEENEQVKAYYASLK